MWTISFAWLSLLILPLSVHIVCSEDLQFVKIPQRREILPVDSNLTIDCTTNNQTAQTAVYYRKSVKSVKWKKIETVNGIKVVQNGSVYTLVSLSRRNRGQYQCRARISTNSSETKWPENVGIVIIRGRLNKGTRKPDSKVKEKKKPRKKKPRHKKPGQKKPKPKKPGNKKTDKKKNNGKGPGQKRPGSKRPGSKRPGSKRPGSKRPGTKRPGNKRPGSKKPVVKRPGSKRGGAKRPDIKKDKRKRGPKPLLKALKNLVSVNESSLAVLKCTARVQGGGQPIISWHRSGKMIGCSDKKNLRCSSVSPKYLITYSARNTRGGNRKKYTSYLRIPKTRRARDRGIYLCMAKNRRGSTRQTIRLRIKKRSS